MVLHIITHCLLSGFYLKITDLEIDVEMLG